MVAEGDVFGEKVVQADIVAAPDRRLVDEMASRRNASLDPFHGHLRGAEPEIEDGYLVALFLGFVRHLEQGFGSQRGLDAEVHLFVEEVVELHQHEAAGPDGGGFGVEGVETLGKFIGIDELAAFERAGQDGVGRRGFSGAVASCYDVHFRHNYRGSTLMLRL